MDLTARTPTAALVRNVVVAVELRLSAGTDCSEQAHVLDGRRLTELASPLWIGVSSWRSSCWKARTDGVKYRPM
jgi:hypothetical protein